VVELSFQMMGDNVCFLSLVFRYFLVRKRKDVTLLLVQPWKVNWLFFYGCENAAMNDGIRQITNFHEMWIVMGEQRKLGCFCSKYRGGRLLGLFLMFIRLSLSAISQICLFCRQRGHSLKNCPNKSEEVAEEKLCYNCGETSHSLSKCPHPIQDGT